MATSDTASLRLVAAAHPQIPEAVLMELLMDENVLVRRAAVKNPSITGRLLEQAIHDSDMGVAAYARLLTQEEDNA